MPDSVSGKCSANTAQGEPCKNRPIKGSSFCYIHQNHDYIKRAERNNIRKYYIRLALVTFLICIVITALYFLQRISAPVTSQIGMGLEIIGAIVAAPEILTIIVGEKTIKDIDSRSERWAYLRERRISQSKDDKEESIGWYEYWQYREPLGKPMVHNGIYFFFLATFPLFVLSLVFFFKSPIYLKVIISIYAFLYIIMNLKDGLLDFVLGITKKTSLLYRITEFAWRAIITILFPLFIPGYLFVLPFLLLSERITMDSIVSEGLLTLYASIVLFPARIIYWIMDMLFIDVPVRFIRWVTYPIRYNLVQKSGILAGFLLAIMGNVLQLLSSF